jgi:asparagine synthase (glutamine-hydrolysing)
MAVSLEARVPYLDTDLVKLAFQVPDHLKVNNHDTKILLKRVASRYLPRECIYRQKEGFSIPIKNWLKTRFHPLMEEFLNDSDIKSQGIFKPGTICKLKKEHLAGVANHSHILWSLIVFHAWCRRWFDTQYCQKASSGRTISSIYN